MNPYDDKNNLPPPYYPNQPVGPQPAVANIGFAYPPQNTSFGYSDPERGPMPGYQTTNANAPDPGTFASPGFSDKAVRSRFVKKVYMILSVQLLVTFGICSLFSFHYGLRGWIQRNRWVYITSMVVYIVSYFALVCCQRIKRGFPMNFICLSVFTLAFSLMVGTITAYNRVQVVVIAMGLTFLVVLSVTFLAACTPIDFTKCYFFLAMAGIVFFLFGIVIVIVAAIGQTYSFKILHLVYCGIGVLLFSLYLAFDTQMVLGGKRLELTEEDYIDGALQLYVDIMNIFIYLLSIVRSSDN